MDSIKYPAFDDKDRCYMSKPGSYFCFKLATATFFQSTVVQAKQSAPASSKPVLNTPKSEGSEQKGMKRVAALQYYGHDLRRV